MRFGLNLPINPIMVVREVLLIEALRPTVYTVPTSTVRGTCRGLLIYGPTHGTGQGHKIRICLRTWKGSLKALNIPINQLGTTLNPSSAHNSPNFRQLTTSTDKSLPIAPR